jgi:hypothetical protein
MSAQQPIKGVYAMQYLLMIYRNEADLGKMDTAERQKMMGDYGAFTQSIIQSGNFKAGDGLHSPSPSSRAAISRPATGCSRPRPRPRCGSATARP